jgi:tRNA(Ile)-lysidine synthase
MDPVELREQVRAGGLFVRDRPVVVLLSGGRDSTCLLDVACALLGASRTRALHVNYGLRERAHAEQARCLELCKELGVEIELVRAPALEQGAGNVQAWARELRYEAALRVAEREDALIATGHTASDQVETILYRLAASPGRRALLGMAQSEGRLIRPLLVITREQTEAYCHARSLGFCEDESNHDERYARTRVRNGVVPALRTVHPAAESNMLRTAALLREETELLEQLVADELQGRTRIALERLRELPAALARMVVVSLAESASGGYVPQAGERVEEILALGRRGGRAELHVGGRAGAVISGGVLEMVKLPPRAQ